ncbi:MAG: hypothetical protein JNM86_15305 [Phycisphaerae bacterium]|nr:hypothetical protein [Phycisphaerae bacterium]MBN8596158.1 hypothetical protein [Planctomycetota bacterium]
MKTSKVKSLLAGLLCGCAVLSGVCVPVSAALAGTAQITLKDGTVLEGEIVRELEGIVWIKIKSGKSEETRMLTPDEVKSIARDGGATKPTSGPTSGPATEPKQDKPTAPAEQPANAPATPSATAATPAGSSGETQPRKSGVPRAAVITLGEGGDRDKVGVYMMAKPLRDAIPLLKQENVDIVVFRINSGGGALLEIQKLSDVIYNDYRKNFRTVAWIDYAISAAAMTSHAIEEIYFTPEGAYGACTGWSGDLVAVKDRDLEQILFQMEKISTRGNHPFEIMRAMQIMEPLSATVSSSGDVTFYQDETSGDILLNPKDRVLTFNSQTAAQVKFSAGTATTLDDLAKVMQLPEIEWVGVKKPGFMWPICRAEQMQIDFREKTARDEQQFDEYVQTLNQVLGMGQGQDDERRAKLAGKARECMNKILAAVNNNPNMAIFKFGIMPDKFREEWVEPTEKKIKEMTKKEKK